MTVFGTIRSDDEVEDAVLATLRKWLPTYLAEVERQLDLDVGYYARPAESSYTVRTDFDNWPEDMLPAIVVTSPGVEEDPAKSGGGKYRAVFGIGVTCIVSSIDQTSARRYAHRMGAAIRAALIQNQSLDQGLDGDVRGVVWIGTRNNEVATDESDARTLWAVRQAFLIEVDDVLSKGVGPVSPDPQPDPNEPHAEWPTVPDTDHVLVATTKES